MPLESSAHPGRTASDGCHYCRTNCAKWGETAGTRHCHGSSSVSPQPATRLQAATLAEPKTEHISARIIKQDYPGFTLHFDCRLGRPIIAEYALGPDTGNFRRARRFHIDNTLPRTCKRQISASTYRASKTPYKYDRGHLVPANHLDSDLEAIQASNLMSNIVPQESLLNRSGAWRETEERIECWREEGLLHVWIGVIWGHDSRNDHFVGSHGIQTPDAFVKLVYKAHTAASKARAMGWLFPNAPIRAEQLDQHSISPEAASVLIGIEPELPGIDRYQPAAPEDWPVPECSRD